MSDQTTPPPVSGRLFVDGSISSQSIARTKKNGRILLAVGAAALAFSLGGVVGSATAPAGGDRVACIAAIDNADNIIRWSGQALRNPTSQGLQAATQRVNELALDYNASKAECKGE